jgi:hypothetical protein
MIIFIIIIIILNWFCTGQKPKVINNNSSLDTTVNMRSDQNQKDDTIPSSIYLTLLKYFRKNDELKIDTTVKIPFSVLDTLLKSEVSDTSVTFYSGINPIKEVKNRYGDFFIMRLNCTAGGDCTIYYLLSFSRFGKFHSLQKLGDVSSEEDESRYFEYSLASDTALLTYLIRYDNEKDETIDTAKKLVPLKF